MTTLEWILLGVSIVLFILLAFALIYVSRWSAMWEMAKQVLNHAPYESETDKGHVAETLVWAQEWKELSNPFKS